MFQYFRTGLAVVAAAGALSATLPTAEAQPSHGAGGACLTLSSIQGTKIANPRTIYVRADGGRTYRIGFSNDCNSADTYSLVMHPVDNNGRVCSAIALDISVRTTGERCVPTSLERLSAEEAAALPPKDRP